MFAFSMIEIASFLVATAVAFVLVAVWVLRSEANRNTCRAEIQKLKSQSEASEREKYLLAEEVDRLKDAVPLQAGSAAAGPVGNKLLVQKITEKSEALEAENAKLKAELDEARCSLEEVYKALCEQ